MDEMPVYEIRVALEGIHLKHKYSWEQARFIAYATVQVNSRKRLQLKDIITFDWERETKTESKAKGIDQADIERLKKNQEQIIKAYNNGGRLSGGNDTKRRQV